VCKIAPRSSSDSFGGAELLAHLDQDLGNYDHDELRRALASLDLDRSERLDSIIKERHVAVLTKDELNDLSRTTYATSLSSNHEVGKRFVEFREKAIFSADLVEQIKAGFVAAGANVQLELRDIDVSFCECYFTFSREPRRHPRKCGELFHPIGKTVFTIRVKELPAVNTRHPGPIVWDLDTTNLSRLPSVELLRALDFSRPRAARDAGPLVTTWPCARTSRTSWVRRCTR
jgi:hypothetical protein